MLFVSACISFGGLVMVKLAATFGFQGISSCVFWLQVNMGVRHSCCH